MIWTVQGTTTVTSDGSVCFRVRVRVPGLLFQPFVMVWSRQVWTALSAMMIILIVSGCWSH